MKKEKDKIGSPFMNGFMGVFDFHVFFDGGESLLRPLSEIRGSLFDSNNDVVQFGADGSISVSSDRQDINGNKRGYGSGERKNSANSKSKK